MRNILVEQMKPRSKQHAGSVHLTGSLLWRAAITLITVAVLVASYVLSLPVAVDVGDYFDRPFLQGFNAPEVSPAQPQQRYQWPAGSDSIELEAIGSGHQIVIVETQETFGDRLPLSLALYADELRIAPLPALPGESGFRAVVPAEIAERGRYTLRIGVTLAHTLVVTPIHPQAVVAAPLRSYRWSTGDSRILLKGIGTGAWLAKITGVVHRPDSAPAQASVWANDRQLVQLPDVADSRQFSLLIPPEVMRSGDLELRLTATPFYDPRELGILTEGIAVAPLAATTHLPAVWQLITAVLIVLGLDLALGLLGSQRWQRALLLLALLAFGAWAISAYRLSMALYIPRLALMVGISVLLLLLLKAVIPALFRKGGVELSPLGLRLLLLLFLAGFWIKAGGMLYPYMVAIDVRWHMNKVEQILAGRFWEFYKPGAFSESVMPTGEWGEQRPVIPYSPFFHIFSTVFAIFPWKIDLTANVFSAIIDNSRVFLIFFIARRLGLRERVGLMAAGLYAALPVTFLLHSWGNIPTTFGMWWTLVSTAFILGAWGRLDSRVPLTVLTLLLTATILFYTVMAVFMTLYLLIWLPLLAWLLDRGERLPDQVHAIAFALVSAILLSMVIYYGQYLDGIINVTIPYFLKGGPQSQGVQVEPFSTYLTGHLPRMAYYGLLLPFIVAPVMIALQWRRHRMLVVWSIPIFIVSALFLYIGHSISMVDKHLFFLIPALVIGTAMAMDKLWEARRLARLPVIAFYLYLVVAALNLWVYRIATVRQ